MASNAKELIFKLPVIEVYKALGTNPEGLSHTEAEERQKKQGKNLIEEKKKKSSLLIFLSNFTHLMAILLWIGGTVAIFADMPQLGIAIFMVTIINGVFSFWQEHRFVL